MALSKEICADPKATAILGARSKDGAILIVSHGSDVPLDARDVFSEAIKSIGGKGGGRADFTQGAGSNAEGLDEALALALRLTREQLSKLSG